MIGVLLALTLGQAGPKVETIEVNGVKRKFEVFGPTKKSKNPPIVFGFHGHGGTMQKAASQFQIQENWPEAVAVYMQGIDTPSGSDPKGTEPGWQTNPDDKNGRDLKFFDAAYDKLQQRFDFDKDRCYAMGFSNGANFTFVLWSQRRHKLAAVAEAAGTASDESRPLKPLPAFLIAGRADDRCKFPKQQDNIKYCRGVEGIPPHGNPTVTNGVRHFDGSEADLNVYIHPGGHMWPMEIDGPVVRFFKNHHK